MSGGLGNQMFQYAAARSLALRNKCDVLIDDYLLRNYPYKKGITPRDLELGCFQIFLKQYIKTTTGIDRIPKSGLFYKYISLAKRKLLGLKVFAEGNESFYEEFSLLGDYIYLDGLFQSERYFKNYEDEIRKEFTFKNELDLENCKLLHEIKSLNSVGIHVRRTDFYNPYNIRTHGSVNISYYNEAILYMRRKIDNPTFFIFSDDLKWVKQNFFLTSDICLVNNNYGKKNYIDMFLMSNCKHNIIANSSFSWWSAWLNSNLSKIIIAPKSWYGDLNIDRKFLLPESWIEI